MTPRPPRPARTALPALLLVLAACAQTFDATSLGVSATLASDVTAPAQGVHFQVSATQVWFGWGLLSVNEPTLKDALAAQLVGGKSVADVKIRTHSKFGNVLVTILTGGLLVPRTVEFDGIIVGDSGAAVTAPPAKP
ncbi:MAG: hypothetical protein ACREOE_02430 [Gemmatimonadales bacterium]